MDNTDEVEFYYDALTLEKYPFRILALVTVLADEKRAYRGTLSELCRELEIQPSGGNTARIKEALKVLVQNQYVHILVDNYTYTITLTHAAAKDEKVLKIKKAWYALIREKSGTRDWGNALKVFLFLLDIPRDTPITYQAIGNQIAVSSSTVQRCVKHICSINFTDFKILKKAVNVKQPDGTFVCLGNTYEQALIFE